MAKDDRKHFDTYREQTRIKHEILTRYLGPYFRIRSKGRHKDLLYIDAFAGPGHYQSKEGRQLGSPLLALQTFAALPVNIGSRISTIFIEKDRQLYDSLTEAVDEEQTDSPLRPPRVIHGKFADAVDGVLSGIQSSSGRVTPSFLFADPCRVDGLAFATLVRYLTEGDGEALLFFNYDGVNRAAGVGYVRNGTLSELMGSDEVARSLVSQLKDSVAATREELIVATYLSVLDEAVPSLFCTTFRVESELTRRTSHYFIHLTQSPLGFRLMKEVMWPLGASVDAEGGFALEQAPASEQRRLFRPEWQIVKQGIIDELTRRGEVSADHFYITLAQSRGNKLCKQPYKMALLELESEGVVLVRNARGEPTTAQTRRKSKGQPTLGDKNRLSIRQGEG